MVYRLGLGALRGAIAVLATGAVADQVTRWFTTDPNVLCALWALLLVALWWTTTRPFATAAFDVTPTPRWLLWPTLTIGAAMGAGGYYLSEAARTPTLYRVAGVLAVVVVVGGAAGWIATSRMPAIDSERYHNWWKRRDSAALAGCMAAAAAMASLTFRASTDDFYYVNMSTYKIGRAHV